MKAEKKYTDIELYSRLLHFSRPYLLHIIGLFIFSIASTPLTLLTPIPLKIAVDSVLSSKPLPAFIDVFVPKHIGLSSTALLTFAAILSIIIALVSKLQWIMSSLLNMYTRERLVLSFQAKLFHHAQRVSFSYHDSVGTTDSLYRIRNDAYALQYITIDGMIPFLTAVITLFTMLYITFRLDWLLTLIALTVVPVIFLSTLFYRPRLRKYSRSVKNMESSVMALVQEVLSSLRVVKAFGQEDNEEMRFIHQSREAISKRLRMFLMEGIFSLITGTATAVGTALILFIGVRHVQSGTISLGNLLLMMTYLSQLYSPIRTIGKKFGSLQSHFASAERTFELLDEDPDVPERRDALPLERCLGSVTFENVSFGYSDTHLALQNISFFVEPGTRVGITGKTGSGKTTLLNLLTRFFDPTRGKIMLDGVDLRKYKLDDLRNQFAIVLQEPVLFSTSIAGNIAYANPHASMDDITAAAQKADAHDFIRSMPDGYETSVGERGMQLSGGERQRIALARAFLKNAPILILDEPTSSVDNKTESTILEAMERLMQGRTVFMIAHRLNTLKNCDVFITLNEGVISEPSSKFSKIMNDSPFSATI